MDTASILVLIKPMAEVEVDVSESVNINFMACFLKKYILLHFRKSVLLQQPGCLITAGMYWVRFPIPVDPLEATLNKSLITHLKSTNRFG